MSALPANKSASTNPAAISQQAMSSAAIRAFHNIAALWQLNTEQQIILLGDPARSTFPLEKEPHNVRLERDTLERISYILGIYKALQILLPDPEAADGWIKRPNNAPLFQGQSALDRMLSGNVADLFVVRQYLDAMRGGWS